MKNIRNLVLAILAMVCAIATAQTSAIVPLPFSQVFAGIAAGGTSTQCATTNDIPTSYGLHLGDGCLPTKAKLTTPYGATVDSLGNVYISDYGDYVVRVVYEGGAALAAAIAAANPAASNLVITPGHIYTLAGGRESAIAQTSPASGTGSKQYYCNSAGTGPVALSNNGDNCPASYAYLKPRGATVDKDGNVFFASGSGGTGIRMVYVGGTAAANLIYTLQGVTPQPGYIYSIVKSSTNGYAGNGSLSTSSTVEVYAPRDVAVDSNENIYLSDGTNSFTAPAYASNNDIRVINGTTGIISTFAGSAGCTLGTTAGCPGTYTGDGGAATSATLNSPYAIFLDASNNLYIADYNDGRLRVVYSGGSVPGLSNLTVGDIYTVAGGGSLTASGSPASQLALGYVYTAGIDAAGNLYVFDGTSKYLWKISASTGIATIIGGATTNYAVGAYCNGTGNGPETVDSIGDGCPTTQTAFSPSGHLTIDSNGNIYETESSNAVVRKLTENRQFPATNANATVTQPVAYSIQSAMQLTQEQFSLQGASSAEWTDAGNATCALNTSLDASTTCVFYVSFTPARSGLRSGSMRLSAGTSTAISYLSGVGTAANASVDPASEIVIGSTLNPGGVAVDLNGNLYAADNATGKVYSAPVTGLGAEGWTTVMSGLISPAQVGIDGQGGIYAADTGNNRIAYVSASGAAVSSLGVGLSGPKGVAVDGWGNVFVADTKNNRIVEELAAGGQVVLSITGLSDPGSIALDPSGNLFIADVGNKRVVEYSTTGIQSTINLGSSTVIPDGIAVDAADDLYIADGSSLQVVEYVAGSTTQNALITGLQAPNGLAVDGNGSLYVADSGGTGIQVYNRQEPTITFSPTNVGASNSVYLNITSNGNANLVLDSSQLTNQTGNTTSFAITADSSDGCVLGASLRPGTGCALAATFLPVGTGMLTETALLMSNLPAAANAGAILSGDGVYLTSTTLTLNVTSPATAPYYFGQPVTITASLTPANTTYGTPTGTITFSVDGKMQPVQQVGNGSVQFTVNPAVGIHTVSVSYSGDVNYASCSGSTSFTVVQATTATTLAIATSESQGNIRLTFSASVSSSTSSGTTGTVSFYSGSTLIGQVTISNAQTAALSTTTTAYSSYNFTAVYSGDSNFSGSTSEVNAPAASYVAASTNTSFATAQGGVGGIYVNLVPLFNYSGVITASCTGLPANSVCDFEPTSVTLSGSTQSVQVLVYTDVASNLAVTKGDKSPKTKGCYGNLVFALLLPIGMLGVVRRRTIGLFKTWMVFLMITILAGAGMLSGCQSTGSFNKLITPAGTSNITVNFTDSTGASQSQTLAFTVNQN